LLLAIACLFRLPFVGGDKTTKTPTPNTEAALLLAPFQLGVTKTLKPPRKRRKTAMKRFWSKVKIGKSNECWPWLGSIRGRYGHFTFGQQSRQANQVAWELEYRQPFPEGLQACHSCDYPLCCNPNHIIPGTQTDNIQQAVVRKRHVNSKKTRCVNGHALTPENVYWKPDGSRACRLCKRDRMRKYRT
jgi:hypothetical protein